MYLISSNKHMYTGIIHIKFEEIRASFLGKIENKIEWLQLETLQISVFGHFTLKKTALLSWCYRFKIMKQSIILYNTIKIK